MTTYAQQQAASESETEFAVLEIQFMLEVAELLLEVNPDDAVITSSPDTDGIYVDDRFVAYAIAEFEGNCDGQGLLSKLSSIAEVREVLSHIDTYGDQISKYTILINNL